MSLALLCFHKADYDRAIDLINTHRFYDLLLKSSGHSSGCGLLVSITVLYFDLSGFVYLYLQTLAALSTGATDVCV